MPVWHLVRMSPSLPAALVSSKAGGTSPPPPINRSSLLLDRDTGIIDPQFHTSGLVSYVDVRWGFQWHWLRLSLDVYCDRCLPPFREADCSPDLTPPGEDWSEFCPSCRDRKLKFYLEAAEPDGPMGESQVVAFRKSARR
jgi:hypothetical protein